MNFFARLSHDVRASVANLSPQNFGDTRTNVMQVSYDGCATVLRKHANTSRLSGEKIKLSHKCRATLSQMSRNCRTTVARYILKIRPKFGNFANLSHK